jgi:predicted DNA-binding transcriptional regulator AlpA
MDTEDTVSEQILEAEIARQIKAALHSSLDQSSQPTLLGVRNRGPPYVAEPLVYTLAEFCAAHKLSRSSFYELAGEGLAPRTFRIGNAVRVTAQAAAEWRTEREAAHAMTSTKAEQAA